MSSHDFFNSIGGLITSLGGCAALIIGLSIFLGKLSAKRILEKEKVKHKAELEQILRYSENQFSKYSDLWITLCRLQQAGENLWNTANSENLSAFANELNSTEIKVEQNRPFFEENHYQELKQLFKAYREFDFGKRQLLDIRYKKAQNEAAVTDDQIAATIQNNGHIRNRYSNLLDKLSEEFRKQIKDGGAS
ncbi:MAG: hypothetical protein ACLPYZ_00720 [Limisphaerales bacterium]